MVADPDVLGLDPYDRCRLVTALRKVDDDRQGGRLTVSVSTIAQLRRDQPPLGSVSAEYTLVQTPAMPTGDHRPCRRRRIDLQ